MAKSNQKVIAIDAGYHATSIQPSENKREKKKQSLNR